MGPYLVFATLPIVVEVFFNSYNKANIRTDNKARKLFLIICGITMFILIALRSKNVGSTDSLNYYNLFSDLSRTSVDGLGDFIKESKMESGFLITIWCLAQVIKEPQFIFVVSGALFSFAVCRFLYKNCEDVVLGFVMYITLGLYIFMVQGLRQAIAMSICLFAIEFCKKRKFVPFFLIVLFATQFHQSAIVFFVVYFIYGFTLKGTTVLLSAFLYSTVLLLSNRLVDFGNEVFDRDYSSTVDRGGFVAMAIYVIILFAALLFSGRKKEEKEFVFFVYIAALGFCFYLMRYIGTLAAERISFYFMFAQIPVLCSTISGFDFRSRQTIKIIASTLCILLFIYRLSSSDLIPYKFFWQ